KRHESQARQWAWQDAGRVSLRLFKSRARQVLQAPAEGGLQRRGPRSRRRPGISRLGVGEPGIALRAQGQAAATPGEPCRADAGKAAGRLVTDGPAVRQELANLVEAFCVRPLMRVSPIAHGRPRRLTRRRAKKAGQGDEPDYPGSPGRRLTLAPRRPASERSLIS